MAVNRVIPIYLSNGDAGAFLQYPYLFSLMGEWIGFVTAKREVYSVLGDFVGTLTDDPRIVRKRATSTLKVHLTPPPKPEDIRPLASIPLARMMADLGQGMIDVLMEMPERLHTLDSGEFKQDME